MTELNSLKHHGETPKSAHKNSDEMSYDFEAQFKQDSTAFYYENNST